MAQLIAVFLGGGLGAASRYLVSLGIRETVPHSLAWLGTVVCNVTGCLAIGIAAAWAVGSSVEEGTFFRYFLLLGFLGGYTTFSTFSLETLTLLQDGHLKPALVNAIGTVALCLIGVVIGSGLGSWLRGS